MLESLFCNCIYMNKDLNMNKDVKQNNSNQESQTQESQTQESQTQESQTQESQTQESQTQESQTQESQTQESQTQESQTQESQTQESQTQESQTQESQTQESQTQELQTEISNNNLLEAKIKQLEEDKMRAYAECENMRKRFEREKLEVSKYTIGKFALDLLEVYDNMQRALSAIVQNKEISSSIIDGVKLITKSIEKTFTKNNMQKVNSLGQQFDQNIHQALYSADPSHHPNCKEGEVIEVIKEGFFLNDRLLRCAAVGVVSSNNTNNKANKTSTENNTGEN